MQIVLRFLLLASLVLTAGFARAADGTIPNQTYLPAEQWTIISPQMSSRHMNQPSVFNGYAIMAGNAVHEVWDIFDPYDPTFRAEMVSNHAAGEAEAHQVTYGRDGAGNYYLATISGRGIDIWNVTNTTSPSHVSEIILPGINYGDVSGAVWGISWQGNHLYCGATTNGLYVVDVSNPASPSHVATLPRSQLGGVSAGPVFALGDLLVVTTPKNTSGIATVDIGDPLNPTLMDSVDPSSNSYIGGFYGTSAYLITPFRSYDVTTDPYNIVESSSAPVPSSEYVAFADDHLFLGGLRGGTEGIYKYDITDPASPDLVGRVVGRDSRWDDQFCCPIGNLLLIADDQRVGGQYVGGIIAVQDTAPDTTKPTVKMIRPADGATGHPLTGQVGISLSEWPEFASVDASSFILRKPGGSAIAGKWGCTYTTLTFAPDSPLDPDTLYEVELPAGGITDLVGNAIETTFTSTFRTGTSTPGFGGSDNIDPVPPVVTGNPSSFNVTTPDGGRVYSWDFGDGNSDSGPAVTHTYAAAGRYAVEFQAVNGPELLLEAEDTEVATLAGVEVKSNNAGYTGTGFADYQDEQGSGVKITWTLEAPAATTTDLTFRYALNSGARPLNLVVNGGPNILMDFQSTGSWSTWGDLTATGVSLQAGSNTIELRADAGSVGANIDHLRLPHPNAGGDITTVSFVHVVYNPLTSGQPTTNRPLVQTGANVWAVNPDAHTITAVDAALLTKTHEVPVGLEPKAIAQAPDGTLWVLCRESHEITIVDPATPAVVDAIPLPYASQPVGLAMAPDGLSAYVTLQALGQLLKLDPATRTVTNTLDLGPDAAGMTPMVRGIAVTADSTTVLVTRFVSPDVAAEVYEVAYDVALDTMSLANTITLAKSPGVDSSLFARGLPNYLTSITISPDGTRAWVPSKKDNIDRGGRRDGLALDHDVTVRAITSTIDLSTSTEVSAERLDHDNSDRCHSCSFSELGDLVFVTLPGNNEVKIVDAYSGSEVSILSTDRAPEGTLLDPLTGNLFVLNFLSRSLSVFNVAPILSGGATSTPLGSVSLVGTEPLSPQILRGKEIFYDASSFDINLSGYLSCASCHLDGSHDGRSYDFSSPMGEGFRNTIDLTGRAGTGHGRVHWTGNFDEIHDFEGQLRLLGKGNGLMSDSDFNTGTRSQSLGDPKNGLSSDLDALAAYVSSLDSFPPSPHRMPNGDLTASALAGKAHFDALGCADCHGGPDFTDSSLGTLHDVGTITANSGDRLGGALPGFDTPTLRGIWDTAPYLHDGSAPTLRDVLTTRNPTDQHGAVSTLSSSEIDELVAYLQQIDGIEPDAAPFAGLGNLTFDTFIQNHGLTGAPETGPTDDYDHDGFLNLTELLLGATSPANPGDHPEILSSVADVSGDEFFQLSWLRRSGGTWVGPNYHWGDHLYMPLGGYDLATWAADLQIVPNPPGLPAPPAGYEWATSRLGTTISDTPKGFMRLGLD